ncbi:hypothetical protein [Paraburkholderia bannensis]|uniref:hypothetical protein n=1 Tax=Paraburkholderia bannensis TaxID=765414 RepID=UPI002AC3310A|nr:hypothetical protein [Paraburkholderia bannensis]
MNESSDFSNTKNVVIEHDHDENGAERVTISGIDLDVVTSCALDVKNAASIEVCPEVIGPYLDIGSGCWRARIIARKGVST